MRTLFLLIFMVFISFSSAAAFEIKSEIYNPPIPFQVNSEWGNDLLVSPNEPFGRVTGVYRLSNNTIYAAIPDTGIVQNKCIVILVSTNNGANWAIAGGISPSTVVSKVKMVSRAAGDSVYCFFRYGTSVYSWNVITNFLNQFAAYTNVNYFDVAVSPTNSLYLIVDLFNNNDVRMYGSTDGGASWAGGVYLSSTGANPNLYMSGTGDTTFISYYGGSIQTDTGTSAIRTVRYRESAPGALTLVGSFGTPVPAGTLKPQFKGVMNGGKVWLFYSLDSTGTKDIYCIQSNDNGATFGPPFRVADLPGRDEVWFDAEYYNAGGTGAIGGVDVIFHSDTVFIPPANNTSRLYYTTAASGAPSAFTSPVQISQKPPLVSTERKYIPSIVEYCNSAADLGAFWVGLNGSSKSVYYDRFLAVSHVLNNGNTVPDKFVLEQNYPNPFNPVTIISYRLHIAEFVSLKIFDVSGREVARLIDNEFKQADSYSIQFNAENLSSGVYFYSLETEGFKDTKKMILVK
ncbi:MAG: T9SS type A sorting domain-containing protein [Ignavibacteria bacterium]|nr:T9SS type A sorting domain-containing protein [Ignavibacteria bacterium]